MEDIAREVVDIAGERRVVFLTFGAEIGKFGLDGWWKILYREIEATVREHLHDAPEFVAFPVPEHQPEFADNDGELFWRERCHCPRAWLPDGLPGASSFARLVVRMKTVRLGMIGCGSMSRYHGKVYTTQVKDAEIVALCDTHKHNLDLYQREIFDPVKQKPPTFADYRDMIAKVTMDAVMIVTPHADHFQQITDSLDAGCMCSPRNRW
jgi:hypothetical protein